MIFMKMFTIHPMITDFKLLGSKSNSKVGQATQQ